MSEHLTPVVWNGDLTSAPSRVWLLGKLRKSISFADGDPPQGHGVVFWTPVFLDPLDGWLWSRDHEPLPDSVELLSWAPPPAIAPEE